MAIYCGTIPKLEEIVYPLVLRVAREYGLNEDSILRFYRESSSKDPNAKKYKAPADSQMEFDILDKAISKKRIVLLVRVRRENFPLPLPPRFLEQRAEIAVDLRFREARERHAPPCVVLMHRAEEALPRRRKRVLAQRREVRLPRRLSAKPFVLGGERSHRGLVPALRGLDMQFFLCQTPHLFGEEPVPRYSRWKQFACFGRILQKASGTPLDN